MPIEEFGESVGGGWKVDKSESGGRDREAGSQRNDRGLGEMREISVPCSSLDDRITAVWWFLSFFECFDAVFVSSSRWN